MRLENPRLLAAFAEMEVEHRRGERVAEWTSLGVGGTTDISFTVARGDMEKAALLVQPVAQSLGAKGLVFAPDLAKVSIVGTGIQTHPGYAARMFGTLAEHNINIHMISTSDIRITCVIDQAKVREAVAALHMGFALDQPDITLPK